MAEIVRYINPASTSGGDGTSPDPTGPNRAYPTISDWELNEETDLVAAGDTHVCYCVAGSTSENTPAIDGWTVSATNFITLKAEAGSEHAGVLGAGFYNAAMSAHRRGLDVLEDYTIIEDLEFRHGGNGIDSAGINLNTANYAEIHRCISYSTGNQGHGFRNQSCNDTVLESSLSIGGHYGTRLTSHRRWFHKNVTVVDAAIVGFFSNASSSVDNEFYNCVAYNCTTGFSSGAVTGDSNASSDGTAVGDNPVTPLIVAGDFTDPASNDYSIADTDSTLYDSGTALETDRPALDITRTAWTTKDVGCYAYVASAPPPTEPADIDLPAGSMSLRGDVPSTDAPQVESSLLPAGTMSLRGDVPAVETVIGVTRTPLLHIPTNPRNELTVDTSDPLRPSHTLYLQGYSDFPVPSFEDPAVTWIGGNEGTSNNPALWELNTGRGEGPELWFDNTTIARFSQLAGLTIPGRPWTVACISFEPTPGIGGTNKGVFVVGQRTPKNYVSIVGDGRVTTPLRPYYFYGSVETDGASRGEVDTSQYLEHDNSAYQISAISAAGENEVLAWIAHNGTAAFTPLGNLSSLTLGPVSDFPLERFQPGISRTDANTRRWNDSYIIAFLVWNNKALTETELNELLNDPHGFFRHIVLRVVAPVDVDLPAGSMSLRGDVPAVIAEEPQPGRTPILHIPTDNRSQLFVNTQDALRPTFTFYAEGGPVAFPLQSFENPNAFIDGPVNTDDAPPLWVSNPNGEGDEWHFAQGPPYRSAYIQMPVIPNAPWTIVVIMRDPTGSLQGPTGTKSPFAVGDGSTEDYASVWLEGASAQYKAYGEQGSQQDARDYWFPDVAGLPHNDLDYQYLIISAKDGDEILGWAANPGDTSLLSLGNMAQSLNFTAPLTNFFLRDLWLGGGRVDTVTPTPRFNDGYVVAVEFWDNKALTQLELEQLLTHPQGFFRHIQLKGTDIRTPRLSIPQADRGSLELLDTPNRPDLTFYLDGGPLSLPVPAFEDINFALVPAAGTDVDGPLWETGGAEGPEIHFATDEDRSAEIVTSIVDGDANVALAAGSMSLRGTRPTTDAENVLPISPDLPTISPGYVGYVGTTDAGTNMDGAWTKMLQGQYFTTMHLRMEWNKCEGAQDDYSGLHAIIEHHLGFARQHGYKFSIEVEGQRFGGSRKITSGAKIPNYLNDTSIYPGDARSAANTGYNIHGGHYFTSQGTDPDSGLETGKWLERLWGADQIPYMVRKAKVHAEAWRYLRDHPDGDLSSMITCFEATSETAKANIGNQTGSLPGTEYSDAGFLQGHLDLLNAFRTELQAVGCPDTIPIMFLFNYWNWGAADWQGRVFDPMIATGQNPGFGVRDVVTTMAQSVNQNSSKWCDGRDVNADQKAGLFDSCMRTHGTVPWIMTAEGSFYTRCNTAEGAADTLIDWVNTQNGTYSSNPAYEAQAGFWPKASQGRNGIQAHWFHVYLSRNEVAAQIADSAAVVPLLQQVEQKSYFP